MKRLLKESRTPKEKSDSDLVDIKAINRDAPNLGQTKEGVQKKDHIQDHQINEEVAISLKQLMGDAAAMSSNSKIVIENIRKVLSEIKL